MKNSNVSFTWGFNPIRFDYGRTDSKGRLPWFKKIQDTALALIQKLDQKVKWKDYGAGMKPWLAAEDRYWDGEKVRMEIFRESFEGKPDIHLLIVSFVYLDEDIAVTFEAEYPRKWKQNPQFKLRSAYGKAGKVLDLIEEVEKDWPNLKPVDMKQ